MRFPALVRPFFWKRHAAAVAPAEYAPFTPIALAKAQDEEADPDETPPRLPGCLDHNGDEEVDFEDASSFAGSSNFGSLTPGEVTDFQGPWELISESTPESFKPSLWVMSFVIRGICCFHGDGQEILLSRGADGDILLDGGTLSLEADGEVLVRTGKSGQALKFRRFSIPTPISIEDFQGIWAAVADGAEPEPDRKLRRLFIKGFAWQGRHRACGLLKRDSSGRVLLADCVLSLGTGGAGICVTHPSGRCVAYHFYSPPADPWHGAERA